jgi:hypothetical protein
VIPQPSPWWCPTLLQRAKWLWGIDTCPYYGGIGPVIGCQKYPILWNVSTGKWDRKYVIGSGPDCSNFEGVIEYIPYKQQMFFLKQGAVWYYDYAANTWSAATSTGTKHSSNGYDVVACYDTKRERIYIGKGSEFKAYDLKTSAWVGLASSSVGSGVQATLTYDAANDIVLSNVYAPSGYSFTSTVRAYNPVNDTWSTVKPMPAPGNYGAYLNAFYDPILNAHFFHGANDGYHDGRISVYRYKKAPSSVGRGPFGTRSDAVLSVSPNPVSALARISFNLPGQVKIQIFNLQGKKAADFSSSREPIQWDAGGLPSGVYTLKALAGNREYSRKILLQK